MIKDFETNKEDLSSYFKSNPKDWELIKWELECQREMAKERAVSRSGTDFDAGICEGLKIAMQIENYYKKWTPQTSN